MFNLLAKEVISALRVYCLLYTYISQFHISLTLLIPIFIFPKQYALIILFFFHLLFQEFETVNVLQYYISFCFTFSLCYFIYFIATLFNRNMPACYILFVIDLLPLICRNRPSLTCFMLSTFTSSFSNFIMHFLLSPLILVCVFYRALTAFFCWHLPDMILPIYFTSIFFMPF